MYIYCTGKCCQRSINFSTGFVSVWLMGSVVLEGKWCELELAQYVRWADTERTGSQTAGIGSTEIIAQKL